eukprot:CAMPEP_0198273732 /NCGR_PEP_ID=MMETSP1447-20131203/57799_1 /TAXON_ID=420782 /ORGANISM="Chaetoceros dichaeta, Strain CCMP1751" /LENGTH=570 /DNA_ID=CAMNT_0043967549 /DNA_START=44 /DNA_END=1756 /DNA_ORIENTATION=-
MPFTAVLMLLCAATLSSGAIRPLSNVSHGTILNFEESSRRLRAFRAIAGYRPASSVSDYSVIDLDQAVIESELEKETDSAFENARNIYENGGHSRSYADLLLGENPHTAIYPGDLFIGKNENGEEVRGKSFRSQHFRWLLLEYEITDGDKYAKCQVGGLNSTGIYDTRGCFAKSGNLSRVIDGEYFIYPYTYDPILDNQNARTIQGFSLLLQSSMLTCAKCPYPDAKYFADYYGTPTYGNEWIEAAYDKRATSFERGNADFSQYDHAPRAECIKKGAVCMNVFMYVLREFEDALNDCVPDCSDCMDDSVHNWDEGVALYTGSLEEADGAPDGKLLHQIADDHCTLFKTCSRKGNQEDGTSKVNLDLLALFDMGQDQIIKRQCEAVRETKKKIADLMYIPLIQGVLLNSYRLESEGLQVEEAMGAVFSASILPRIHAVNEQAAKTIYNNMRVNARSTSYISVRDAFLSVYKDLNIDCGQVGGLWDKSAGEYYKDASPCGETSKQLAIIILIAALASAIFGLIATIIYNRGKGLSLSGEMSGKFRSERSVRIMNEKIVRFSDGKDEIDNTFA